MAKYILSIDQGTTSSRAILFDHDANIIAKAQKEFDCIFPQPGWVEVDPNVILLSVKDVCNEVIIKANLRKTDIDSIAITNQRETSVVWDKNTGLPVYNAIVWQSRQSKEICDNHECDKDFIQERTGLIINPYFSASKIRYILDHVEEGQKRAESGELLFGTIDSWLIYKLTDNNIHATDITNASRTLLFNIKTLTWDKDLCSLFNIPLCMLPKVYPSSFDYGIADLNGYKGHICGVAGDQQAALFGHACFSEGDCKNTYGTGCFMLLNVGKNVPISKNGLLTTIAWQIGDEVTYALEGSVYVGGASVQWLRDQAKLISLAAESEDCAYKAGDTKGIYFVPAFVGLATPYWDNDVRGAIFGLTRGTDKNQIVKVTLEGIAYECKDVFVAMEKETGIKLNSICVDGGASANSYLMQFQCDIINKQVRLPKCLETTALGVAYLAGLCTGFFKDLNEIKCVHSYQKTYIPKMNKKEIKERYKGWKLAVKAAQLFKL